MNQQNWQNIIFNACIALNCMLLFVLAFHTHIQIPAIIQAFGRAHPLVLHFPIVLLLLAFLFEILIFSSRQPALKNVADWILLAAAFTSAVAALMGFFLSKEAGYEGNDITIHKWMGISCSILSFVWFAFRQMVRRKKVITLTIGSLSSVVLLITGHKGANITHGSDFLLAPVMNQTKTPAVHLDDAVLYSHLIQPLLEAKCMSCHNSNKAKGELIMETEQLLLKGGKHGRPWDTSAAGLGLMMQRIHLPVDNEEHMPPKGKPQLTEEETRLLHFWIKNGASFTQKVKELPDNDSLRLIASLFLKPDITGSYNFSAAEGHTIKELNTEYRVITPIASGSPALAVNFYGIAQFKNDQLKELEKIKNNIVSLHLSKMPVTDEDLKFISQFKNLTNLNISFTLIKGTGLKYLSGLQQLKQLSLSGTAVQYDHLKFLIPLKKLLSVEIWNTPIDGRDLLLLQKKFSKARFETGYSGDTVIAKLSAPIIDIDEKKKVFKTNLAIKIKIPISGAIVRYTLDGSEPDSMKAAVYKEPVIVSQSGIIKAKAFLKGWMSSAVSTAGFYKNSLPIDSIQLLTPPAGPYIDRAKKGKILMDGLLGTTNFGTGDWMGYRDNNFEAYLFFKSPTSVRSVTFNTLIDINSYIFPPVEIQVWGGNNIHSLKLLSKIAPKQPTVTAPAYITLQNCPTNAQEVSVLKLMIKPVKILPVWHPGKGDKGWVFLDELFIN